MEKIKMSNKLEFGYHQQDITPKRGISLAGYFNARPNRGAYDRLFVKAAVFRDGETISAIASFDICYLERSIIDRMDAALAKAGSPLSGKVIYSATHTHTGPQVDALFGVENDPEYLDSLIETAAATIIEAYKSLAPAELYTGKTECTTLAFNRRYFMKGDRVLTNPGKLNPDICRPEGGCDHDIMMIEVHQDDRPVLLITNISNHTDTIGGDIVSADWPGRMEAEIQHALGWDLPVMTIIAPQGNINHFDVTSDFGQTSFAEACRIGKAYAAVILASRYRLAKLENCSMQFRSTEFAAPFYQLSDAEYAEAKRIYEENKDAVMEAGKDFTSEDIARGVPAVKKFFAERAINCREKASDVERFERQAALTFGDQLAIVTLPAEPFVEIGFAIREKSRFPMTVLAALSQGEIGYVGLENNYGNEGYELRPSPTLADRSVGETMIKSALELLK